MAKECHACGEAWTDKTSPGFRETCLRCGAALHCCRNCRFFDANAAEWCREPMARRECKPNDPEESNRCDFFQFADGAGDDRQGEAKAGLAALFGDAAGQATSKPTAPPAWAAAGKAATKPAKPAENAENAAGSAAPETGKPNWMRVEKPPDEDRPTLEDLFGKS